jgi:phage gp46-like protein
MTTDIKIKWDNDLGEGDFIFEDNDFDTDEGLGTAVLISWFTDQRASDDDSIPNADNNQEFIDKRGWWGDLIDPVVVGDQIGSKLWLLSRAKTTQGNLTTAIEYGTAALDWMKQDGIAKDIVVKAEKVIINNDHVLVLQANITKTDGSKLNISFDPEWFATFNEN